MNQTNNVLRLNNLLLSIAGYGTNIREDILLDNILSQGYIFDKRVKRYLGVAGQCHLNSTYLWNQNRENFQLCTGYALFENVWYCHSWLIDRADNMIIDTNPALYEKYFGCELSYQDSEWLFNFLWKDFI